MSQPPDRFGELEHRASVAEAEKLASDDEVKALERRLEQTLELLAQAQEERAKLEFWLGEHRASLSWRITEPLRVAKRKAILVARGRSR